MSKKKDTEALFEEEDTYNECTCSDEEDQDQDQDEEEEDEEEEEDSGSNKESEEDYNDLDPDQIYFKVELDDYKIICVQFTPIEFYEENESWIKKSFKIDSLPDYLDEISDCIYEIDCDSDTTEEDIEEELVQLGFVPFPYKFEKDESIHASDDDEVGEDELPEDYK